MLDVLRDRQERPQEIEIHTKLGKYDGFASAFQRVIKKDFPDHLPRGAMLRCFIWKGKENGERFHKRFLLTDIGGLSFEGGLDAGKPGETTDVFLLEPSFCEARREEYGTGASAFELIDSFEV